MKRNLLHLAVLGLVAVSIALAVKVNTDYDHKADLSRYKTYTWMQVKADPLWTDRIRTAIDSQLSAKGWTLAQSGGDASIAAFGATKQVPTLQTFYTDFGGGWYWRGFGDGVATTSVDYSQVGTLVVDIFDTSTKKLIWRATASDVLSDKAEKNEKKLENAVEEMFNHFPSKIQGLAFERSCLRAGSYRRASFS
jgi:Domain of unknown function (DUF4136)